VKIFFLGGVDLFRHPHPNPPPSRGRELDRPCDYGSQQKSGWILKRIQDDRFYISANENKESYFLYTFIALYYVLTMITSPCRPLCISTFLLRKCR
jgi:hypothetical protein